jgi:hypothetical protein
VSVNTGASVYHMERTLGAADNKQVLAFPFDVPPGCGRLEITLSYAPERVGGLENMLVPALFDPVRCRGAAHRGGATKRVVVEEGCATPGFLAGRLQPGGWTVEIEVHAVLPGEPCRVSLDILVAAAAPAAIAAPPILGSVSPSASAANSAAAATPDDVAGAPAWYRGDLHTHSVHSDGHVDVAGRIGAASEQGLDFFFLTDHNTVSGLVELATRVAGRPTGRPLLLGGMELTTFYGHALCLGARGWTDWRVRPGDGGMPAIVRAAEGDGRLFVIAHPLSVDDPYCTGCAWHFDDVMPGPARAVEVWNGPWAGDSGNEANLALWYAWLNRGEHVVGTAASDAHGPYGDAQGLGFSVVYSAELREEALLDAIRRGHLYLSGGPRLALRAHGAEARPDRQAMMGDALALAPGEAAEFSCRWEDCPASAQLRVIVDGQPRFAGPVGATGQRAWRMLGGQDHWCLVEVRDLAGDMLALTNPVYL